MSVHEHVHTRIVFRCDNCEEEAEPSGFLPWRERDLFSPRHQADRAVAPPGWLRVTVARACRAREEHPAPIPALRRNGPVVWTATVHRTFCSAECLGLWAHREHDTVLGGK